MDRLAVHVQRAHRAEYEAATGEKFRVREERERETETVRLDAVPPELIPSLDETDSDELTQAQRAALRSLLAVPGFDVLTQEEQRRIYFEALERELAQPDRLELTLERYLESGAMHRGEPFHAHVREDGQEASSVIPAPLLQRCIDALPDARRTTLMRLFVDGLAVEQLAAAMGIKRRGVYYHRHEALKALADAIRTEIGVREDWPSALRRAGLHFSDAS